MPQLPLLRARRLVSPPPASPSVWRVALPFPIMATEAVGVGLAVAEVAESFAIFARSQAVIILLDATIPIIHIRRHHPTITACTTRPTPLSTLWGGNIPFRIHTPITTLTLTDTPTFRRTLAAEDEASTDVAAQSAIVAAAGASSRALSSSSNRRLVEGRYSVARASRPSSRGASAMTPIYPGRRVRRWS